MRFRIAGAGDFPCQQVANELAEGNVALGRRAAGGTQQFGMQEDVDPGVCHAAETSRVRFASG